MGSKRKPVSSKKQNNEQKKNSQVFKTALPLVLTTILLGLVYYFVLTPVKPINTLKTAISNTLDPAKQKSLRYDGTFGDEENEIKGEFNGQKASNGDMTFFIKVSHAENAGTVLDYGRVSDMGYFNIAGVDSIPDTLAAIPGAKPVDADVLSALKQIDDKWVSLDGGDRSVASSALPCSTEITGLFGDNMLDDKKDFPLDIVAGPYNTGDGSTSLTFEVKLKKDREIQSVESTIAGLISCLDGLRGDDYRLREVNQSDIDAFKVDIVVDPLSNTVQKIVYKQFGNYFQIYLRDFNKDVTVTVPDGAITLKDALLLIPAETQLKLLQNSIQ